jgi:mannose-6-phosphate isomerase-like protein (cupin superfamily)
MHNRIVRRCLLVALAAIVAWHACPSAHSADETPEIVTKIGRLAILNAETTEKVEYPWGWIRWLMNSKIDKDAPMTFGIVEINAGTSNPLHVHPNCDEYLYVLSGSCKHVVGDQLVTLKPGDMTRIPKGVPHKATVVGDEPLKAVIVYSSGDRQFKVLEEGGKE